MFNLSMYTSIVFLGLFWIARDRSTEEIFDCFGRSFSYVWHCADRWKLLFMFGWRLLLLVSLIVLGIYFAYQLAFETVFLREPWIRYVLFLALSLPVLSFLPWIFACKRMRYAAYVKQAAISATDFSRRIASGDFSMLEKAEYETDPAWTAWHPTEEEWNSGESKELWDFLMPVCYINVETAKAVFRTNETEDFLSWGDPSEFTQTGKRLPFYGPGRLEQIVKHPKPIRRVKNWWIIRTETIWPDWDLEEPSNLDSTQASLE